MRQLIWGAGAACGIAIMTIGMWAVMSPPLLTTRLTTEIAMLVGLLGLFAGLFLAVFGTTKAVRAKPRF